jgi:hypothetical protein
MSRTWVVLWALGIVVTAGCGGGEEGGPLVLSGVQDRVSACGGFESNGQPLLVPNPPPPAGYCDAEVLHWRYTAASGLLELAHTRVTLNCCATIETELGVDGETLRMTDVVVTEGLCDCICVFDFGASASGVPAGQLHLRLERRQSSAQVVWEGDLDLSAGSGEITTSTEPPGNCG